MMNHALKGGNSNRQNLASDLFYRYEHSSFGYGFFLFENEMRDTANFELNFKIKQNIELGNPTLANL